MTQKTKKVKVWANHIKGFYEIHTSPEPTAENHTGDCFVSMEDLERWVMFTPTIELVTIINKR